jgi:MSHA biogenesis protein MshL
MPVARIDNHIRPQPSQPSQTQSTTPAASAIPQPVRQVPIPPPPKAAIEEKRYSVTVIDVPAREILLAMSRDTGINIDIHSGIEGRVTLNAIDQTIKQILTRISRQIDMRWELDGPNIAVLPDSPYLKLYKVDYVNMSRESSGTFGVQTQVVGPSGTTSATAGGAQNSSLLKIDNTTKNRFWESLEKNVKDMLRETDKQLPEGSTETFVRGQNQGSNTGTTRTQTNAARTTNSRTGATAVSGPNESQGQNEQFAQTLTFREAASVIVNAETGTISVRATSRQHEKVGQFIEQVAGVAKRQVLIEATVVEVVLNDNYQSGVDWSALGLDGLRYSIQQSLTGANLASNFFSVQYNSPNTTSGGNISSTVKLLNSFGTTKVLSSPRATTLNNQPAVLKVVENQIYFTVKAEVTVGATTTSGASIPIISYTSTPNVVPEGFVMSVTPQVGENDIVTLNIRPSITRITSFLRDPNPDLARAGVVNNVPIIQTREFETVLRVPSGQTAILGGLMQDSFIASRDGIPILSRIPIVGDAVSYRNDTGKKSELVVFIRAIVIKDASVETDFSEYRRYLPDSRFFKEAEPFISTTKPVISDPVQPKP